MGKSQVAETPIVESALDGAGRTVWSLIAVLILSTCLSFRVQAQNPTDTPSTPSLPPGYPFPPGFKLPPGYQLPPGYPALPGLEGFMQPQVTPSPSATPAPLPSVPGDPLSALPASLALELGLAESGWKLNQSLSARARLLNLYERAVEQVCMKELLTAVRYSGPPDEPYCRYFITLAKNFEPESPALACAEDGIDSERCLKGYEHQSVGAMFFDAASLSGTATSALDVDRASAKLADSRDRDRLTNLSMRSHELRSLLRTSPSPEIKTQLDATNDELLRIACKFASITLTPTNVPPGQGQPAYRRTRTIQPACLEQVRNILLLDPDFAPATCAREGYYTPACTKARRDRFTKAIRALPPAQRPGAAQQRRPQQGMAEF